MNITESRGMEFSDGDVSVTVVKYTSEETAPIAATQKMKVAKTHAQFSFRTPYSEFLNLAEAKSLRDLLDAAIEWSVNGETEAK